VRCGAWLVVVLALGCMAAARSTGVLPVLLAALALAMACESAARLLASVEIAFDWAIAVAAVGLAVNALLAKKGAEPVASGALFGDIKPRTGAKPKAS